MPRLAIFGATSAIAQETARLAARRGDPLFLVARNADKLQAVVHDLETRFDANVSYVVADLNDFDRHAALIDQANRELSGMDTLLIAHGILGDQSENQEHWPAAQIQLTTNLLSPISILTHAANLMETRRSGTIAVITSVAGDRGRKSNYVYGTTKGGLIRFLQGLRNRLHAAGVHVVDIRPGLVRTPMTAHMKPSPLAVSPDCIAKGILRAIDRKRHVTYLPARWRLIMAVIRAVPESIFKRLSL